MNKLKVVSDIWSTIKLGGSRTGDLIKEKSPELIFAGATFFIVKGVVEAYKAAPEWKKEYEDHKKRVSLIHDQYEAGNLTDKEESKAMVSESWTLTKEFLAKNCKCIIYTAGGIAGYSVSHKIVRDREKKWMNLAGDLALGLMAYRGRVAEEVGTDKEFDLFHNIKRELVEEEYIDEKGKKKKRTVEKVVNGNDSVAGDDNSFWFGIGHPQHQGIKEYDLSWVIETEMMFNRILVGRGHGGKVTREEVERFGKWYDNDRYKFNAHNMGWVYDANRTDYEYYLDPITGKKTALPRIIKFTCSKDFMNTDDICDETWIEFNCYPIDPILKQMQEDLLDELRRARGGKYIPIVTEDMAIQMAK